MPVAVRSICEQASHWSCSTAGKMMAGPGGGDEPGVMFNLPAFHQAVQGLDAMTARGRTFQDAADASAVSLSSAHPWGFLNVLSISTHLSYVPAHNVRDECTALIDEFRGHLRLMQVAMSGAKERLSAAASIYSATETTCAEM